MSTNLAIYWPLIYEGVYEKEILVEIENTLFDVLNDEVSWVEFTQFVNTASSEGLKLWESMFNITAVPHIEPIEFRRQRIINRFTTMPPFTVRYLSNRLTELFGEDGFELNIIYDEYLLDLKTYTGIEGKLDELALLLQAILPANIAWTALNDLLAKINCKSFLGAFIEQEYEYNILTYLGGENLINSEPLFIIGTAPCIIYNIEP